MSSIGFGALLQRGLVVFRLRSALRGDALLDVGLALGGERGAIALVVEVELLARTERGAIVALVLDDLHARSLTRDEDRENGGRARRRLVVEEDGVELRLAALLDREEHGLCADEEVRVARGEHVAVAEDRVGA